MMSGNEAELLMGALVGLTLGVIVGIVIYCLFKRDTSRSPLSCPSCRYPVKGISSLNCPECGADFREVGITPGGKKPDQAKRAALLIGAIIAIIAAVALGSLFPKIM